MKIRTALGKLAWVALGVALTVGYAKYRVETEPRPTPRLVAIHVYGTEACPDTYVQFVNSDTGRRLCLVEDIVASAGRPIPVKDRRRAH